MALSNIFKEPRRELTESAVGIAASVVPITFYAGVVWGIAQALGPTSKGDMFPAYVLGVICAVVGTVFIAAFLAGTHALGDAICNGLEKYGVQLRPKQRYL